MKPLGLLVLLTSAALAPQISAAGSLPDACEALRFAEPSPCQRKLLGACRQDLVSILAGTRPEQSGGRKILQLRSCASSTMAAGYIRLQRAVDQALGFPGSPFLESAAATAAQEEAPLRSSLGLRIDPAFTDRERERIEASAARIPVCRRELIRDTLLRRRDLSEGEGRQCVQGTAEIQEDGTKLIELDPAACGEGIVIGTIVHEFFHLVGFDEDSALERLFRTEIVSRYPACPVSDYGATDLSEDFAESGRLAYALDDDIREAACVPAKLEEFRRLVGCGEKEKEPRSGSSPSGAQRSLSSGGGRSPRS